MLFWMFFWESYFQQTILAWSNSRNFSGSWAEPVKSERSWSWIKEFLLNFCWTLWWKGYPQSWQSLEISWNYVALVRMQTGHTSYQEDDFPTRWRVIFLWRLMLQLVTSWHSFAGTMFWEFTNWSCGIGLQSTSQMQEHTAATGAWICFLRTSKSLLLPPARDYV